MEDKYNLILDIQNMKPIIGINFGDHCPKAACIHCQMTLPKLLTMLKQLKINATLLKRITPPNTWQDMGSLVSRFTNDDRSYKKLVPRDRSFRFERICDRVVPTW